MNKLTGIVIFAFGAAIGSIMTRTHIKKKYERIIQEEIDSVKEVFSKRKTADSEKSYEQPNEEEMIRPVMDNKPYVIPPEHFGEMDDYEKISLTYYADGILTNENDEPIEDIESTVGTDSLNHFGEYEDDSVFVRNDVLGCDYEILLDQRRYR